MILLVVTVLFTLVYVAMVVWLLQGWRRLPESHVPPGFTADLHVAVIVPARNEEERLPRCLDSLLEQNYPKHLLDVIIVNDHSEDNTLQIAQRYAQHGFTTIDLKDFATPDTRSYKKLAIETAIRSTQATLIATLDADCTVDFNWLTTMVAALKQSGDICVLGPVMPVVTAR